MHEMAITQGIIDLCLEHAVGRRIHSIDVEIGELSSVVPEAVEFCFEACSRDTLLEGARLVISRDRLYDRPDQLPPTRVIDVPRRDSAQARTESLSELPRTMEESCTS